jgi:hypothetical protein
MLSQSQVLHYQTEHLIYNVVQLCEMQKNSNHIVPTRETFKT